MQLENKNTSGAQHSTESLGEFREFQSVACSIADSTESTGFTGSLLNIDYIQIVNRQCTAKILAKVLSHRKHSLAFRDATSALPCDSQPVTCC